MRFAKKLLPLVFIFIAITMLVLVAVPGFAATPHEDPANAATVFSGVALFNYYAATLDLVIREHLDEVAGRMDRMPFANIPFSLQGTTTNFVDGTKSVSQAIVKIDLDLQQLSLLLSQSRVDEATQLLDVINGEISDARTTTDNVEQSVVVSGYAFRVSLTPETGSLRRAYDNLLAQIGKIRDLLDLDLQLLSVDREQLTEDNALTTNLSLVVEPTTMFVGDSVRVTGELIGGNEPLGGRAVHILIDNRTSLTVTTDAGGHYEGTLSIPYQYISQMEIQTLYHPQNADEGTYLASLSQPINMNVLFYKANIIVQLDKQAYPGRAITVQGNLDYAPFEPTLPLTRLLDVSLDDIPIGQTTGTKSFLFQTTLPANIDLGSHVITVSMSDEGRYAPSFCDSLVNVVKAQPVFVGSLPGLVIIPGSFSVNGDIRSEIGPLAHSSVSINLGSKQISVVTGEDGTFTTNYHTQMGWGLIGSDLLEIRVTPQEPWNTNLYVAHKVLVFNVINGGIFLGLLLVFGVTAPRRLRMLRDVRSKKIGLRTPQIASPETMPVYTQPLSIEEKRRELPVESAGLSTQDQTLFLYRILVNLVQRVTHVILKPQQTFREFAVETSTALGPLASHFLELTRIVEKLIYSPHKGTVQDGEKSEQLTKRLRDGLRE